MQEIEFIQELQKVDSISEEDIGKISSLATSEKMAVRAEVACLLMIKHQVWGTQKWFKDVLNSFSSISSNGEYNIILQYLDTCLYSYLIKNVEAIYVWNFFDAWIREHKKIEELNIGKIFPATFSIIFKSFIPQLESFLTRAFNNDSHYFHFAAEDIIKELYHMKYTAIRLDPDILNKLSDYDIKFIVFKILGYVSELYINILCEMMFSILEVSINEKNIRNLFLELFTGYFAYDFPDIIKEFLQKKYGELEGESNRELRRFIKKIIKRIDAWLKQLKEIPRLKEFHPPLERRAYYRRLEQQHWNGVMEEARKSSIFSLITQDIVLKGGTKWFTSYDGNYTEKEPLNKFEMTAPLPRSDFTDPVGRAIQKYQYRFYKRESNK